MSELILRELQLGDEPAFLTAVKEFESEGLFWITFDWKPEMSFADHLARLQKNKAGLDLPDGHVPSSIFYGFVNGEIVGRVSLRHELNAYLRHRGGHIGYSVCPRFRGQGYATKMFQQTLPICRKLGLERIMITCDDDNIASWRLLERAGAVLDEKFYDEEDESTARRYWLEL